MVSDRVRPCAFRRYQQKANLEFRHLEPAPGQQAIHFTLQLQMPLSIIYDHMDRFTFFDKIGIGPWHILSYATYRYWVHQMQEPFQRIYEDDFMTIREDLDSMLVTSDHDASYYEVVESYAEAVHQLVSMVYPYLKNAFDVYQRANAIVLGSDCNDLSVEGLFGNVASFYLVYEAQH